MTPSRRQVRSACAGGCNFPANPGRSAIDEPIHWTTEADPGKILLIATPGIISAGAPLPALDPSAAHRSTHELHAIQGDGGSAVPFVLIDDAAPDQALAAVIPLDTDAPDRLDAVSRLLRALTTPPPPADLRVTPQRRRRLRHMLRAFDGRASRATYREIAEVMFGASRVASDAWKTSPLRDATIRLARDGLAMVNGGYRDLLRRRRRR
jgi:hypothetical protein